MNKLIEKQLKELVNAFEEKEKEKEPKTANLIITSGGVSGFITMSGSSDGRNMIDEALNNSKKIKLIDERLAEIASILQKYGMKQEIREKSDWEIAPCWQGRDQVYWKDEQMIKIQEEAETMNRAINKIARKPLEKDE